MLRHSDLVYVKKVKGKGRGVFARKPIPKGTVIEKVPKMLLSPEEMIVEGMDNPNLSRIFFIHDDRTLAVCLGYGSIYNHSYEPNARYTPIAPDILEFHTIRPVAAGEEILINYHGNPDDKRPVDFDLH